MPIEPEELLQTALALPVEARSALIDSLLESLDPEVDAGAEEAWLQEVEVRRRQIESGAVTPIPWDEARRIFRSRVLG